MRRTSQDITMAVGLLQGQLLGQIGTMTAYRDCDEPSPVATVVVWHPAPLVFMAHFQFLCITFF